jgi:hypothetical protein
MNLVPSGYGEEPWRQRGLELEKLHFRNEFYRGIAKHGEAG